MNNPLNPDLVWIKLTDQIPPEGRLVYTRDETGLVSAHTRYGDGYNILIDTGNARLIEWLDVQLPVLHGITKNTN